MQNIYEAKAANTRKSFIVVTSFFIFVSVVIYVLSQAFGYYLGYEPGGLGMVGLALIVSGLMSFGGYYFSDTIVLALSGAKPVNKKVDSLFYSVVQNLCIGTGLPMPKLYVIEDSAPNAFATGRDPDHAAICITRGLLDKLTRTELEGVLAHELSHVRNYDTRLMAIVAVLIGTVALMADWFLRMSYFGGGRRRNSDDSENAGQIFFVLGIIFAILSPIIGQLIQLAISRRREFMADASSVEITRQPQGLISALKKISGDTEPLEAANKATAHLYIMNPFKHIEANTNNKKGGVNRFAGLFNTHPPTSDRIKALEKMA